jgi:hypothetical protein
VTLNHAKLYNLYSPDLLIMTDVQVCFSSIVAMEMQNPGASSCAVDDDDGYVGNET